MGKKDKEERSIEDLFHMQGQILNELVSIRKLFEKGSPSTSAAQPARTNGEKPFTKGKYPGKTPTEVLQLSPEYIEFIYKSFVNVASPNPAWSMVTSDHYRKTMQILKGGAEEDDSPKPAPPSENKRKAAPDLKEDDIPF